MSKIILTKNNKGGVGKSWITLQLAHALQICTDKKILILTTDAQNNILHYSGYSDLEFKNGLEEWIAGKEAELIEIRNNLFFIPLKADYIKQTSRHKLIAFIASLREKFEYIVIDSTPTLSLDKDFLEISDEIIIPTFLDNVSNESIAKLVGQIGNDDPKNVEKIKVIIPNRYTRTSIEEGYYKALVNIYDNTGILLTVPIKQSSEIGKLIDKGKTIWETSSQKTEIFREIFLDIVEVIRR